MSVPNPQSRGATTLIPQVRRPHIVVPSGAGTSFLPPRLRIEFGTRTVTVGPLPVRLDSVITPPFRDCGFMARRSATKFASPSVRKWMSTPSGLKSTRLHEQLHAPTLRYLAWIAGAITHRAHERDDGGLTFCE